LTKRDIVVFSALTPHRTGPNVSSGTRKAYILQYAVDGTRALRDGKAKKSTCSAMSPSGSFSSSLKVRVPQSRAPENAVPASHPHRGNSSRAGTALNKIAANDSFI